MDQNEIIVYLNKHKGKRFTAMDIRKALKRDYVSAMGRRLMVLRQWDFVNYEYTFKKGYTYWCK